MFFELEYNSVDNRRYDSMTRDDTDIVLLIDGRFFDCIWYQNFSLRKFPIKPLKKNVRPDFTSKFYTVYSSDLSLYYSQIWNRREFKNTVLRLSYY